MIEMTVADMFLLTWAILASAFALRFYEQDKAKDKFVHVLINEKDARDRFFNEIDSRPKEDQA